ncbi:hypothetical protein IAT38_001904 [Cryptococcus sp. DSM 104549]
MAACVASPTKHSHPAIHTYLATPPLTPTSPTTPTRPSAPKSTPITPVTPAPSYAMLRAHHAYALKYTIAKLRWDQVNNLYLPGQDADWNHDQVIICLEKELHNVEEAQRVLDRFPNCFAPISFPKPHGPQTSEEAAELKRLEEEREKLINDKLDAQFPFLKQLFIGPMTKQQARNDKLLREQMREGDFEDLSILLPSANMRMLMNEQQKKAGAPRKNYEQHRMEKERAKVAAMLEAAAEPAAAAPLKVTTSAAAAAGAGPAAAPARRIGPLTKEEHLASLPFFGPLTKEAAAFATQRRHRQLILGWLHKPWGKYDEEAAGLMEKLAETAKGRMEEEREKIKERAEKRIAEEGKGEEKAEEKK